jgi:hypothetical protein
VKILVVGAGVAGGVDMTLDEEIAASSSPRA